MTQGTLFAVGVGPGDPELVTLKAVKALQRVRVIFAAASPKNDSSQALAIAGPHLAPGADIRRLDFPMTRDQALLDEAWRKNAAEVMDVLAQGLDAAFLTLGDPMTYSTFGYLLRTMRSLGLKESVEIVPGITSYQAAAARTGRVLAESDESLVIIPGVCSAEKLENMLRLADKAVVLKAYRNFPAIREALDRLDLADSSVFVSRLGLPDEAIHTNINDAPREPHYLTLLLVDTKKRT